MKVTVFTLEFPPNIYGGVGVHVSNITKVLARYCDVEVRTIGEKYSSEDYHSVHVRRYPCWSDIISRTCEKFRPVFKAYSISLAVNSEPIDSDIVHFHTWYMALGGLYAKKLYNVKLVATVHSLEPMRPWKREALGSGYNLSMWAEMQGLKECDAIIAVSGQTKEDIVKSYGISRDKIHVIHNGIDAEVWRPREDLRVLERYGIRRPYALFVGRLSRQKGIFTLVEAAKIVGENCQFVFATGKPDERSILEEFKRKIRDIDNIVWINKMLNINELIPLYTMASVFVCPSIYEPFGIVNLEAMATEAPVVASRVGGIPEIVKDRETGILVEPNNPEQLADAITYLLENPEEAVEMGRRGRRRVLKEFTWEKIAEKTFKLYCSLLD